MSTAELAAWAVFLLPLLSFALIALVVRRYHLASGWLTVAAIGGSFILALWLFAQALQAPEHQLPMQDHPWVPLVGLTINLGLTVDALTAVMLVVITSVSLLIQIYSIAFMHGDAGYPRYFAVMALFTASMLGLVLADNLIMLYVFWELVGLCSYLLIGHWFHRPSAAAAAKKAFIVTRFGDFGFLVAILLLATNAHTVDIAELYVKAAALPATLLTWAALGVFSGAVGKSAQFPLHVWLPDAMEGPSPVSALIHAATMVAAGVYLVARLFPFFAHSPEAMTTVAIIGGFTAIFAASMGLVMNDIKRVMAYSTISQLGYMMLALGVGGYVAGIFHLFNHAFFKALLFLGSGSVGHATGTYDMRFMGGLRRAMPTTFVVTTIAGLSLAGIPPFSGFWSKDEIISATAASPLPVAPLLTTFALITVFLTAFYMFRAVFMTFGGAYRGGAAAQEAGAAHGATHGEHEAHLHESPKLMTVPMAILALLSVVSGFANAPAFLAGFGIAPHWFADFTLSPAVAPVLNEHAEIPFNPGLAGLSIVIGLLGILLAYAVYSARWLSAENVGRVFGPLYRIVARKYGFDDLYEDLLVTRSFTNTLCAALNWFDWLVVDGLVNGVGRSTVWSGAVLRRLQVGQLQAYSFGIVLGLAVIIAGFLILRF